MTGINGSNKNDNNPKRKYVRLFARRNNTQIYIDEKGELAVIFTEKAAMVKAQEEIDAVLKPGITRPVPRDYEGHRPELRFKLV
jgi:ribosome biogenesis protein Nip4